MTKNQTHANTPFFVLRNDNQPIYPKLHLDDAETNFICIYGFSSRLIYDQFIRSTKQPLVPYPLVEGYLANQISNATEEKGIQSRLVILDATDVEQSVLSAATMDAVILAQQKKLEQVEVECELRFDAKTGGYRFANNSN